MISEGRTRLQAAGLWLGLGSGLAALLASFLVEEPQALRTLAVALAMGVWWVTEAIPIGLTSLLPAAAFPFLGIVDATTSRPRTSSPIVLLS
ncbi:MAG: hypothetical protein HC923_11855, partial [Myxococcales bacterium]|nr:hypothetical protein [Myxococcales bacterium]